jgi:hypothetical protein
MLSYNPHSECLLEDVLAKIEAEQDLLAATPDTERSEPDTVELLTVPGDAHPAVADRLPLDARPAAA